jgi:4-hydroxybenzoate polyprenyltransferase/geranylgeranylglycerol-phosphate geranylgeranyltransferase
VEASGEAALLATAQDGNVLSRFRATIDVHSECGRPDVGVYVGLVGLGGVLLASGRSSVWHLVAAVLIPALLSTAAYYGGAYFDREIDAVTKPGKPVPSGRMSARSALISMTVCAVAGLVLAAVLSPVILVFALAMVLIGASYRVFRTARRPIRVFTRGIATLAVFGIAVAMTSGPPKWDLILLGLIFWQQDSMLHQILAIEDTEIDRRAGVSTTLPTRYGHKAALAVLVVTLLFWFSSAALQPPSVTSRPFDLVSYAPFFVIATVLAVTSVVTLFRAPRPLAGRPVVRAYGLLALERPCVAAGFVAASGALVLGLVVLVVSTVVTLLVRRALAVATPGGVLVATAEPAR